MLFKNSISGFVYFVFVAKTNRHIVVESELFGTVCLLLQYSPFECPGTFVKLIDRNRTYVKRYQYRVRKSEEVCFFTLLCP
jgi:hypothetical protein